MFSREPDSEFCARLKIIFSYDSCDNLGVGVSVRVKVRVHFFFASCARLLVSLREPLPTQHRVRHTLHVARGKAPVEMMQGAVWASKT